MVGIEHVTVRFYYNKSRAAERTEMSNSGEDEESNSLINPERISAIADA
jgi:hypothetical protein